MRELLAKRLAEPCQPALTSCCQSMNLVATVTQRNAVDVWRMNGQRVFGLSRNEGDEFKIDGLAWKDDGRMLAVAQSNGNVLLIDSFSGKAAHQLQTTPAEIVNLPNWAASHEDDLSPKASTLANSNVSWSTQFANAATTRDQLEEAGTDVNLDDLLTLNADVDKLLNAKANLPKQLAQIDIETSLPKLSTLPATGADDDVFSTRNSIDAIFHSQSSAGSQQKASSDMVDVLLAKSHHCFMHIRILDTFEIGTVDVSQALPKGLKGCSIVQYASHPLLSVHFFVIQAESDGHYPPSGRQAKPETSLHLVGLDLRFIPQNLYNLPLLAHKATQLQNLIRYVSQIQSQLSQEIRTAFDLPTRFLRNINESLAEQDSSSSFSTAAYHLVVTGECDPRLKEWLVDEVGERGLKRWEKAVGDCLELIRRMMSECLLPAIERCQVVLSRLDGMARFSDTATRLGLDERKIRLVRETLDMLTILCEDLLRDVCVEAREFGAFMRWIRWEAEVEALEETSERAEEMRESYSGEAELRTVLDYISGAMKESRVLTYIDVGKDAVVPKDGKASDEALLFENYKKARRQGSGRARLPKLEEVIQMMRNRSEEVLKEAAKTLRKNILTSYIDAVGEDSDSVVMDSGVFQTGRPSEEFEVRILACSASKEEAAICTVSGPPRKGAKVAVKNVRVPGRAKVLDIKFGDESGFFALVADGDDVQLLWHELRKEKEHGSEWETRHHFPHGVMTGGMTPATLAMGGQRGKRTMTVLDKAGMGFVVLALDS